MIDRKTLLEMQCMAVGILETLPSDRQSVFFWLSELCHSEEHHDDDDCDANDRREFLIDRLQACMARVLENLGSQVFWAAEIRKEITEELLLQFGVAFFRAGIERPAFFADEVVSAYQVVTQYPPAIAHDILDKFRDGDFGLSHECLWDASQWDAFAEIVREVESPTSVERASFAGDTYYTIKDLARFFIEAVDRSGVGILGEDSLGTNDAIIGRIRAETAAVAAMSDDQPSPKKTPETSSQRTVTDDSISKLMTITKSLKAEGLNRPEIRMRLRSQYMDLLVEYSPNKAQDDSYPSDSVLQRWYQ